MDKRTRLADIKEEFSKYIVIKDEGAIDITLGTAIGNLVIPSDPVWMMIIAASSGGKSTLLAPFKDVATFHFVDDLTEKTLLSGYKIRGQENSLLKRIGSGTLCFSDFTAILGKNSESRGEILTQFRMVFDGSFTKTTGTGEIVWTGKMGFLGAATPEIYAMLDASKSMGERFMYYIIDQPTDEEIVAKQSEVNMSSKEITQIMKPLYKEYTDGVRDWISINGIPPLALSPIQVHSINRAAMFCVRAKATVHTDYKTGRPDAMPNQPGVGRDRKMFNTLAHALQIMDAYEMDDWKRPLNNSRLHLIDKCAWSSINRERRKVLEILTSYDTLMTAAQIGAAGLGLEAEMTAKYLSPLHAVGLVHKITGGKGAPHKWVIESRESRAGDDTIDFIRSVTNIEKKNIDELPAPEITDEDAQAEKDFNEF